GNDRQVAVGHDDTVTVKNDRKTEVMHDRREQVGNDETLVVGNDRKMSVKGKQEQTTTGDHISLVKGMKSQEVKGDLAQKISGALGIKVQSDIVLESSSRISLKVGGSFVVIHPGGVDIMGPKINLNSGGSPGTPVGTLQPAVLKALASEGDVMPEQNNSEDSNNPENNDSSKEQNEPESDEENRKIQIITNKLSISESQVVGLDFKIRNENDDTLIRSITSQSTGESELYPEALFSDACYLLIGKESDEWQVYVSVDDL
ncbi:TPA: bacteriophage T4 gp5 trimerization domain-containing protein, partial [Citrobacter freundii]|nr:hypothetical protein [Citrobacter freundii]